MANPFYVQPANTSGLLKGLYGGMQAQQENEAAAQAEANQQALTAQAQELFRSGDLNAIAQFSIANPEFGERIREGQGAVDEGLDKIRLEAMTSIVSGGDPYAAANKAADAIEAVGGDPSRMRGLLDMSPEEIVEMTRNRMAVLFPNESEALRKLNEKKFSQASGKGMTGWVFNEQTGDFSLDPNYEKWLLSDAAKLSNMDFLDAKAIAGVNDKVTGLVKDVTAIHAAAIDLMALEQSGTTSDQIAAVFKFMKAMDPSSTVRESELGMIYSAEGAAQGFANYLNSLIEGKKLNPEGFRKIVNTAKTLANSAIKSTGGAVASYTDVIADNMTPKQLELMRARVPVPLEISTPDLPKTNAKGWELKQDDSGNRAYVGPDGEIEEV